MNKILSEIKQEFPFLRPFKMYSCELILEGFEYLSESKYFYAEKLFKMNILAYPDDFAGYEGLAYIYSQKGNRNKSIIFINHAIKLARKFSKQHSIGSDMATELENHLGLLKEQIEN